MNPGERGYLGLLWACLNYGNRRPDRTGVGRRSRFGPQLEFELDEGFPLLTTKKIHLRLVIAELLWMLSGETNVRPLQAQGVNIWDQWADEIGDLGPVYGKQWRSWGHGAIDQIGGVVQSILHKPWDSGHVVSAWNVDDLADMALRPCHCLFQFFVEPGGRLSCKLYQRSADIFVGVPFNIASYSLLTLMVAKVCGLKPGRFIHTFGDVHLYENHVEQAALQLGRAPRPFPSIELANRPDMDSWTMGDFTLRDYDPHPFIPAPVAK